MPLELKRLAELHLIRASDAALRVFAHTSTVYPEEWMPPTVESCTLDLMEFAFHARRVDQICIPKSFEYPSIDKYLVSFSNFPNDAGSVTYRYALNLLHHAKRFVFGNAHADHRKIFLASSSNLIPTYVTVESDKFPAATISLYGLVDCFLGPCVAEVRRLYPEIRL